MRTLSKLLFCAGLAVTVSSCDKLDDFLGHGPGKEKGTIFENKSELEPLVAMKPQFNFVKAYSLKARMPLQKNWNMPPAY